MSAKLIQIAAAATLLLGPSAASAADCKITVGAVLELTGPAGSYGQAGAKGLGMAFRDINAAGGVRGCDLVADIRDSQSQGNVAVDAATQLVQVQKVPLVIGGIISAVSLPILTSVTAPAKVVQISPASSSPTLTALGRAGKTNGVFFRTIPSDALQAVAAAKFALDKGFKRLAIIHVNSDFGVNLTTEFSKTYKSLGGEIVSVTPYNERQSSYQSEITAALKGNPDALYMVTTPIDGATIARTWISQGGVQKFMLSDGMYSQDFIKAVGAEYLKEAYGTAAGTKDTASTEYFNKVFKEFSGMDPGSPPANRAYDAAAIAGLALAIAGSEDRSKIRDAVYAVVDPDGTPIYAGKEEFAKAFALIKDGKKIRYEGVIGPIVFDKFGDITASFSLWQITNGQAKTIGEMSIDDVNKIKAGL